MWIVSKRESAMTHSAFDWRNPNKLRALIGAFAGANPIAFHREDGPAIGDGEVIERLQARIPKLRPHARPMTRWRRMRSGRSHAGELERLAAIDPCRKTFLRW
ncbi:MAG: hypothetical protein CM15mP103_04610 [Gammaproteobacteria bacterium]|nr:MAG: hypothetical protein CM15mP103_04610 [Gammaproteobacteria bacterium]